MKPRFLSNLMLAVVMAFTTGCGLTTPGISNQSVGKHLVQQASLKAAGAPRAVIEFRPGAEGRGLSELSAKFGIRSTRATSHHSCYRRRVRKLKLSAWPVPAPTPLTQ